MKRQMLIALLLMISTYSWAQGRVTYSLLSKDNISSIIKGVYINDGKIWAARGYSLTITTDKKTARLLLNSNRFGPEATFTCTCSIVSRESCKIKGNQENIACDEAGCAGTCRMYVTVRGGSTYEIVFD